MSPYVLLAKEAVENYVKDNKIISPTEGLPDKKTGVFVTITKGKELRGCIGTYRPVQDNIGEEIIHNAIAAATEDYRFSPIQEEELPCLSYTVYLLSEPESIKNTSELNPKKYGIIVKSGFKAGLLLPDLDGVETKEQQIAIACQKGAINSQTEPVDIYRFTVEKYEPR